MKFEHFALNVPEVRVMSRWYVEHLGLRVVLNREEAPYMTFLADDTGRVIMEIYTNPSAVIPDYAAAHPLCFHIAFVADDPRATQQKLEQAGASLFLEENLPDGSRLIMMRDPWGVPLQLCKRTKPF
ncbi:MAG TPA: VOC family protein [Opitutaceae bacterium]|jgi:glyoxylase I family protein|nr:VOC family protein [Opitutaceae bacterium]